MYKKNELKKRIKRKRKVKKKGEKAILGEAKKKNWREE